MSDVVTPAAPRAARARSVHGVEVLVRWQDRTLERAFLDGQRRRTWTLGERGADFAVSGRWLGVEALEVLRLEGGEARLGWSRRAPLSLTRDGATVPVPGAGAVLGEGEVARWPLGPLTLEARWTVAPRAAAVPLAERLDYRALNIGLAVAAVAALGIARASFAAAEDPGLADGAPGEQARIARFLVAPRRRRPAGTAPPRPAPVTRARRRATRRVRPSRDRPGGTRRQVAPESSSRRSSRAAAEACCPASTRSTPRWPAPPATSAARPPARAWGARAWACAATARAAVA